MIVLRNFQRHNTNKHKTIQTNYPEESQKRDAKVQTLTASYDLSHFTLVLVILNTKNVTSVAHVQINYNQCSAVQPRKALWNISCGSGEAGSSLRKQQWHYNSIMLQYVTHREKPGPGIQALQLGPGKHGSRVFGPVGENLMDVGGPLQGVVVHQEGNPIRATTMTWQQHKVNNTPEKS